VLMGQWIVCKGSRNALRVEMSRVNGQTMAQKTTVGALFFCFVSLDHDGDRVTAVCGRVLDGKVALLLLSYSYSRFCYLAASANAKKERHYIKIREQLYFQTFSSF